MASSCFHSYAVCPQPSAWHISTIHTTNCLHNQHTVPSHSHPASGAESAAQVASWTLGTSNSNIPESSACRHPSMQMIYRLQSRAPAKTLPHPRRYIARAIQKSTRRSRRRNHRTWYTDNMTLDSIDGTAQISFHLLFWFWWPFWWVVGGWRLVVNVEAATARSLHPYIREQQQPTQSIPLCGNT